MPKNEIKKLLKSADLWDDNFTIKFNPNIRGQSISYFVYNISNKPIFIAKFFDYLKGITIPPSVDISTCQSPSEVINKLADADDFMGNIDEIYTIFYYQERSFLRYVEVCSKTDCCFPKTLASKENILINSHFYSLLIEEAIDGITLENFLQSADFNFDKITFTIEFLLQMSSIIEKFINLGIVHRDLSPDNIMVSNQYFVVIDPGIVKIISHNTTQLGIFMGKYCYASPEQARGEMVNADFTCDLYSIGLIAFEIISGVNPLKYYMDSGNPQPYQTIISKYDRELEDIFYAKIDESEQTRQLFLIIQKLLQVDKTYRFNDISSLQEAITILKEDF